MTATATRPATSRVQRRAPRPRLRSWWRDSLEALAWLVSAGGVAFMLASGTASFTSFAGLMTTLGRLTGIVAATMIMVQLVLASRVPVVERVVGHDQSLALHGRLGRVGFFVMLVHALAITLGYAEVGETGFLKQAFELTVNFGGPMTAAVGGFALLCLVIVTSLALVRSRWRYENWHAVHLFSYAAIVLTIPHQFLDGSTFATSPLAWWYWAVLWTVTVGALLVFRVLRPAWQLFRYDLRVAALDRLPDGSVAITVRGNGLKRLAPRPGQFFLFRFLTKELWDEAHPYSLSRARNGDWLRITVKPLGDHSRALAGLAVGTKVGIEGPLGVFHDRTRTGSHLVLAGAGIGLTPILSMLEAADFAPGECTVIVRARSESRAPHLDEIRHFAALRGATVHTFFGPRGFGWSPVAKPMTLGALIPQIADADVFACGPSAWVDALRHDASTSGLREAAFHAEFFTW
jgi:predicted ferric reductase